MESLALFLEKYKKLPTPKGYLKNCVTDFLGGVKVEDVSYGDGVLYVKAGSVVKQELFIKKKQFIEHLAQKGVSLVIRDIR